MRIFFDMFVISLIIRAIVEFIFYTAWDSMFP